MAWEPQTKKLWAVVNERDELGDKLVPDYITEVKQDGFYGDAGGKIWKVQPLPARKAKK